MKLTSFCLITTGLLVGVSTQAQEKLPREECLKYAYVISLNLPEMLNTPIPTEPDVKRPVAFREDEYGAMLLPESKLNLESVGKTPVAVGQLWLRKLAPLKETQLVSTSKLRVVKVKMQDNEAEVVCCALGVRKTDDNGLELLVYGSGKEPVIRAPLKSVSGEPNKLEPLQMSIARAEEKASITLKILAKYEATFDVTDPERYQQ